MSTSNLHRMSASNESDAREENNADKELQITNTIGELKRQLELDCKDNEQSRDVGGYWVRVQRRPKEAKHFDWYVYEDFTVNDYKIQGRWPPQTRAARSGVKLTEMLGKRPLHGQEDLVTQPLKKGGSSRAGEEDAGEEDAGKEVARKAKIDEIGQEIANIGQEIAKKRAAIYKSVCICRSNLESILLFIQQMQQAPEEENGDFNMGWITNFGLRDFHRDYKVGEILLQLQTVGTQDVLGVIAATAKKAKSYRQGYAFEVEFKAIYVRKQLRKLRFGDALIHFAVQDAWRHLKASIMDNTTWTHREDKLLQDLVDQGNAGKQLTAKFNEQMDKPRKKSELNNRKNYLNAYNVAQLSASLPWCMQRSKYFWKSRGFTITEGSQPVAFLRYDDKVREKAKSLLDSFGD